MKLTYDSSLLGLNFDYKLDRDPSFLAYKVVGISPTTLLLAEADLGMFSMFGRTGAPTKRGPHKPEIVGRQHDIF